MKLRAIRLKEFRRFTDPIAVENLTGDLDVLAAPNEDGKSTLFEAVRTIMGEKYNAGANSKKMKAIQPYVGGAPLIEIDFDLNGGAYRLRKQFVKRPDAVLIDRDTGRDIARKDDVEDWLAENLTSKLPFGLFWVAQQASVAPAMTEKTPCNQVSALRNIVEAEVGAIAGGKVRDDVRRSVSDDLDKWITSRGPKKNGAYDLAVTKRDKVTADLETARKRKNDAETRLARLEALREERAALISESENSALGARVRQAESALKKALHANTQLKSARQEEETSKHQVSAVSARLREFDARAKDHADLTAAQKVAAEKLNALKAELAGSEKQLATAVEKKDALDAKLKALRKFEKAARLLEQRTALKERIARREAVLTDARATDERIAETLKFLADEPVTTEAVQTLQQIMGEVAALSLRAEQMTPKVTVKYQKGAEGSVHADGQTLADGMARPVIEKTDFVIDGVGRFAVDPGDPRDRDEDADDLAAHQEQRDDLMGQLGVTTLKQAQKRAADRDARTSAHKLDKKRLAEIAPDGIKTIEAALSAEQAKFDALPEADPSEVIRPREDIETDIAALEPEITEQAKAVEDARQGMHALQLREAEGAKDVTNRMERINALSQSLDNDEKGNVIGRDVSRSFLAEAATAAENRLNEAVRSVSAWADSYVNDEAMSALEQSLSDVRDEDEISKAAIRKLDQEQGEIDAVLRETAQDGIDEIIGELEGELERAEKEVAYFERRIEALQLLARTLDDVAEDTRQTYTQPIVKRLSPYLHAIFPDAKLSFSEHFSANGLVRNEVEENFANVSLGTQEQIGVLTRLGFARLFADRNQPLPLILDDALVYSDDERIERMFDALRLAAKEHQVLILTCRMRAFEGLGGNRIRIEPCSFG